ncbi:adenosine/guanosine diphosphatase [Anaeramoeba ignava]|uniref:Adenosine/guanosine diphosphatase n=1 Tax=Anaeramoeba ignava TaxID=1746090 RepID=A0A9Q0LEK7_ANAIG|nr:adenosine/guanosine diphosphatase [Anaeramoeba ignava]
MAIKHKLYFSIWLLSFSLIGIYLLSGEPQETFPGETITKYGIVIDAGSTGSRIHIYKWSESTEEMTPFVEEIAPEFKTKPGISYSHKNLEMIDSLVGDLLDFAMDHIPKNKYKSTVVYLQATAGIRLLPKKQQESIINKCREVVHEYPFLYTPENIRVITGEEESLFGWITVNFLTGNFEIENSSLHSNKSTIGCLDLGGGSVQIAYVPSAINQSSVEDKSLFHKLFINGSIYRVYAVSFLGYGATEANIQMIQYLEDHQKSLDYRGHSIAISSCYPYGFWGDFCTTNKENCKFVLGNFDYQECKQEILQAKFPNKKCNFSNCSINGTFQPDLQDSYVGLSVFFHLNSFLFGNDNPNSTIQELTQKGDQYCNLKYSEMVKTHHKNTRTFPYLGLYCFYLVYSNTLLENIFGFSINGEQNINKIGSVDETEISWTTGSIIYHLSNIHQTKFPVHFIILNSRYHYIFFLICFALFFVSLVFVFIYLKQYLANSHQIDNNLRQDFIDLSDLEVFINEQNQNRNGFKAKQKED